MWYGFLLDRSAPTGHLGSWIGPGRQALLRVGLASMQLEDWKRTKGFSCRLAKEVENDLGRQNWRAESLSILADSVKALEFLYQGPQTLCLATPFGNTFNDHDGEGSLSSIIMKWH